MYNKEFRKTKIKFYGGKINSDFHGDEIPRNGSHCICVLVIVIDYVFKMEKISRKREKGKQIYYSGDIKNSSDDDNSSKEGFEQEI